MPSKPNYNHQRAERDRAKKASKEAKLRERKEQAALRKARGIDPTQPDAVEPDATESSGAEPGGAEPGGTEPGAQGGAA
jgi:hypothetical protein